VNDLEAGQPGSGAKTGPGDHYIEWPLVGEDVADGADPGAGLDGRQRPHVLY
jgi:hypothetical protein